MKTRKTKKRNIIRRTVAFLLCMTMVLGLGMQDVIEQVYAEEAIPVIEQEAATEAAGEPAAEEAAPEESAETAEEPDESVEEAEEQPANSNPFQPAYAEENTKTDVPSAPAENAGSEEGEKQNPSAPAEDGQSGSDSETSAEMNPGGNTGNEITAPTEDGNTVTNPDETTGENAEDDAAVSDEEEETTEPEEKVTELTYAAEDGSFSVTAAAVGEDTDLSSYELHAAQVQKDGEEADRYAAAEELVAGALDAESRQIEELRAYDIWFTYTESGETADLSGQVQISLEYTAPEFPEGTDAQLEVFCLNGGAAEAVDGTDALAAGCELYALAWAVPAGYENVWENDQVIIRVTAEDGVVPEGAELSVTPIVKTEEEELANLPEEEKAKAEDINKQYDETEEKLNEELEAQNAEEMAALAAESASADVNMVSESGDTSDEAAGKKLEGFLAFDISFLVENENGEITEVEPSDKVNVSIEFKQATIPDEVSEDAEVSVAHLKEETNEAGETEIVVEDLTEADTTTVETTDKAEVTKVELVAEEFSIFTINWTSERPYYGGKLEIQVVDEEGESVDVGNDTEMEISLDEEVTVEEILANINASGYTFSGTIKVGYNWKNATIKNVDAFRYRDWEIQYKEEGEYGWSGLSYNKVYFVYEKVDLTIADYISPNGLLTAVAGDELQQQLNQAEQQSKKVSYVWYKSENGEGFEEVTEIKSGDEFNIQQDGKALDIIIDGADKANETKYKVAVFIEDDKVAESAEFEIPYYKKLQNGSFEVPVSDQKGYYDYGGHGPSDANRAQWSNENYAYQGGVWQTTGLGGTGKEGQDIEVLNMGNQGGGSGFMNGVDSRFKKAADGVQYAEINCETSGALYQDVLTNTDMPLNYWLSHRARSRSDESARPENKRDTMYLVIMPSNVASGFDSHSELVNYLNDTLQSAGKEREIPSKATVNNATKEEATVIYNKGGVLIARITSDAADWHYVDSNDIEKADGVETTQYVPITSLSRFFFISGATHAGDATEGGKKIGDTIGNFVDRIGFGQEPVPANPGEIQITVNKTVTGLTKNQFEELKSKLTFTINAENTSGGTGPDAPLNDEKIKADAMEWTWTGNADGTITAKGSITLSDTFNYSQEYLYKVTESGTEISGLSLTSSVQVSVSGGEKSDDEQSAVLGDGDSATFDITNDYVNPSSFVNYSKTATGADCDERVYQINLSAATTGSTAGTEGDSASIVLVLDASSSMEEDFDELQEAADSFINTAAEKVKGENSGNIEIAVVWYNGSQGESSKTTSVKNFLDVGNEFNVKQLTDFIDKKETSGGTPMGDGLEEAEDLLTETAKYPNKYVLFFTDGRPGFWSGGLDTNSNMRKNCMVANDAVNHANAIKKIATIYTVGYGNDLSNSFYWHKGDPATSSSSSGHDCDNTVGREYTDREQITGEEFLARHIATVGCAITTEDSSKLSEIFTNIAGSMGSNRTTETEKIQDVIDSRFNLLVQAEKDESVVWRDVDTGIGYRLAKTGDTIQAGDYSGYVSYDNATGVYTITWNKVIIPNANDNNGWSASFYIKAKEDFIGGNVIPTNGSDSGIYITSDNVLNFPMPTVNVKLLELSSENKEVTYFKGESVNPKSFIQELLNTAKVVELVKQGSNPVTFNVSDIIGQLSEEQIDTLINGSIISTPYEFNGTNDVVGSFTLQLTAEGQGSSWFEHRLDYEGNPAETYQLKITYTALSKAERKAQHADWSDPTVCGEVNDKSTEPTYNVNVVAGSILIKKTISVDDLSRALDISADDTVTFTFNIEGSEEYAPSYVIAPVTITFNSSDLDKAIASGEESITKEADPINGLAKDIYTVSEAPVTGFEASGIQISGWDKNETPIIDYDANTSSMTGTLYVGNAENLEEQEGYLNYRDGAVTFTNAMVLNNWQIVKVSGSNSNVTLEGAVFTLTSEDGTEYTGTSGSDGILKWTKDGNSVDYLEGGIYTLEEAKAPGGYQLSKEKWIIEISPSGALISIKNEDETEIQSELQGEMTSYIYKNELLYDLPEAGGPGIYLYMLGGVALMMAGTLLVYKKRKEEVLRS